jgi:hypothetical protein
MKLFSQNQILFKASNFNLIVIAYPYVRQKTKICSSGSILLLLSHPPTTQPQTREDHKLKLGTDDEDHSPYKKPPSGNLFGATKLTNRV